MLYQDGQFAANETVTLIGPRSRVISNLRNPRPLPKSEPSRAGVYGFYRARLRTFPASGDIKNTPGAMLMGRPDIFEMGDGVIPRAAACSSAGQLTRNFYGVKHGDRMKLKIGGDCGLTLDKMLCRVDKSFKLEVHIDTDEGNACNLQPDTPVELCEIMPINYQPTTIN